MRTPRWAAAALVMAVSLVLATAACSPEADRPGPAATPTPVNPKDALLASVEELFKTSFAFTMTAPEGRASGSVDAPAGSAKATMNFTGSAESPPFTMDFLVLAGDTYVKFDFGALRVPGLPPKDKWQHLDMTKIKDPDSFSLNVGEDPDPAGAKAVFGTIVNAQSAGDRRYTGTLDLSSVTGDPGLVNEDAVKKLGAAAKSVPFEAVLDERGRLVSLKVNAPAAGSEPARVWEVAYRDYGSAPTLEKPPAGEVQEARQSLYDLLNSDEA